MVKRNVRNPRAYKPARLSEDIIFHEPDEFLHRKAGKNKGGQRGSRRHGRRHSKQAADLAAQAANRVLSSNSSKAMSTSSSFSPTRVLSTKEGEKERGDKDTEKGAEA